MHIVKPLPWKEMRPGRQPNNIFQQWLRQFCPYNSILAITKPRTSPTSEVTSHPTSKNSPPFVDTSGVLPYSQKPGTGIYPEPDESSPQPPIPFKILKLG
jgi:hypothetical protein